MVVYLAAPTDAIGDAPRVGVVVSKEVGGSVQRHRAARRIRAVLAQALHGLPDGSRMVVRALPGADRDPALASDLAASMASVRGRS